jgi:hypothetical protein
LGVLGAESASTWPGWNEVQEPLREWLPQTEPFVLAGANHALQELVLTAIHGMPLVGVRPGEH